MKDRAGGLQRYGVCSSSGRTNIEGPLLMYRDGLQAARDRYHAARNRVEKLRARLDADQQDAQLPDHVRYRLGELERHLEPTEQTVEGITAAEEALDEYAELLRSARVAWKHKKREERRQRHDQALASIRGAHGSRALKIGMAIVFVAVLLVVVHHVRTSVSCLGSEVCALHGQCSPELWSDRCLAKSDEDCSHSQDCRHHGRCTAQAGYCVAGSDSDCMRSSDCANYGYCKERNGSCRKEVP